MKTIDRSMYVNQLPAKNQLMVLEALTKHANKYNLENPAEQIADAMNSRLFDLDEVLPDFMQYSSADKYIVDHILSCDDDEIIDAWNAMCFADYDDENIIHRMNDFSEFFEHGEAFDIVASAIRGSFDPDLDYFKVFTDHRLNLDRICSYSLWGTLVDLGRLARYMIENPGAIPGGMDEEHKKSMLAWFDIEE